MKLFAHFYLLLCIFYVVMNRVGLVFETVLFNSTGCTHMRNKKGEMCWY